MMTTTILAVVMAILILGALFSLLMRRKEHVCLDEDLISQLPNDVLVVIISGVPTKTAVATSILSKRWRDVYKSMSSFEIECRDLMPRYISHPHRRDSNSDAELFINRLEGLLRLCSGSKIQNFYLDGYFIKPSDKRFEQCIYYLGKSGVEQLHLCPHSCPYCRKPSFSCQLVCELASLKYLELSLCSLQPHRKSTLNYSLQTLNLEMCALAPGFVECILSNCTGLQALSIYNCSCPPKLCIRGQLNTLKIGSCDDVEEIELCASNLNRFELVSIGMVSLVFDHVPQLDIMYISAETRLHRDPIDIMSFVFGELPKCVAGLRLLAFRTEADLYQEEMRMRMGMGRFLNLRVLDMTVNNVTARSNLLALIPYLETCPLLEELQLNLSIDDGDEDEDELQLNLSIDEEEEVLVAAATKGAMRKLKKAEISGFGGSENEIEFALWMLKSGVALQEMRIIRCFKDCRGHGNTVTYNTSRWTKQTLQYIKRSLVGQAISPTANLILLHR